VETIKDKNLDASKQAIVMQPIDPSSVHAPAPPIQATLEEIQAKSSIPQATRTSLQITPHLQTNSSTPKGNPQLVRETFREIKEGGSNPQDTHVMHKKTSATTQPMDDATCNEFPATPSTIQKSTPGGTQTATHSEHTDQQDNIECQNTMSPQFDKTPEPIQSNVCILGQSSASIQPRFDKTPIGY
jgi:hypothetical protein